MKTLLSLLIASSLIGCGGDEDCRGPFDAATSVCPATYDQARAAMVCTGAPVDAFTQMTYGLCAADKLLFMARDMAMYGYTCYYDSTSKQLVGESAFNDNDSFCDRTSYTISGGRVPAHRTTRTGCLDEQIELQGLLCPRSDGGADAPDGSVQD